MQPGEIGEQVVEGTGEHYMAQHHDPDPQIKFPIPNEKQQRRTMGAGSSGSHGTRKIQFKGADPSVGKLPVSPPGLMWRGQPAISTTELLRMGEKMMTRNMKQNSRVMTRSMNPKTG